MKLFTNIPTPKRTVVITEQQAKVLKEATDGNFSTDELNQQRSFAAKMRYCQQHLGQHVGRGSSRIVYQIDDEKVLKLAFNEKGIAQNQEESYGYKQRYDFIPKIFETDNDYQWIICEYVLPAKKSDFKYCLGISWDEFDDFVNTVFSQFSRYYIGHDLDYEEMGQMAENNEMLWELKEYIENMQLVNNDITRISNWGLAKRNGNAYLVFLDHGLSDSVYNQYYKRR